VCRHFVCTTPAATPVELAQRLDDELARATVAAAPSWP
jgi:hypothetical protein